MRLSGLASGMDVDSIVSQLMAVERRPVYMLQQQQTGYQARLDAWKDIRSKLDALQSKLKDLQLESNFTAKKATVGDEALFTAAAGSTAVAGDYTVEVVQLAQRRIYQAGFASAVSDATAALNRGAGQLSIVAQNTDGTGTVTKTVDITDATSLNDIVATINGWTDVALTARAVEVRSGEYELVVEETRTGAKYDFTMTQSSGTVFSGITSPQVAQDAIIKVDGVQIERAANTIDDAITGVTLTLKKGGGSTSLKVEDDVDKVVSTIKAFVDAYNAYADSVKKHTKYDADKKTKGPLLGDISATTLTGNIAARLGKAVSTVAEEVNSLSMIGITTEYTTGRLTLDETKLKEKLTAYGADIQQLFQDATEGLAITTESFIKSFTGSTGLISDTEGSIQKQIDRIKDKIDFYENVILPKKEARLRQQFTRMEQLLAQFQSQGAWLQSQLAGMN